MNQGNLSYYLLLTCSLFAVTAFSQNEWRLVKNDSWIQVYESNMNQSNFRRVKVVCNVEGTYSKLIKVLNNVDNHKTWIYNTKNANIIKSVSANEYYYYTETSLPWPLQNRDIVVHIKFYKDSLNRFLKIEGFGIPDYLPEVKGKVRVPRSSNTWLVTMPKPNQLHIVYVFEADPGGSLPAWLVNALVTKGPYESFKKLAEQLKN
jgi:hypothetical protein